MLLRSEDVYILFEGATSNFHGSEVSFVSSRSFDHVGHFKGDFNVGDKSITLLVGFWMFRLIDPLKSVRSIEDALHFDALIVGSAGFDAQCFEDHLFSEERCKLTIGATSGVHVGDVVGDGVHADALGTHATVGCGDGVGFD